MYKGVDKEYNGDVQGRIIYKTNIDFMSGPSKRGSAFYFHY